MSLLIFLTGGDPVELINITLFERIINVGSGIFGIMASGIAIFIVLFKRGQISSAFKILVNYSYQLTIAELKSKVSRLNDFNIGYKTHKQDVVNILSEVEGQIRGNKTLSSQLSDMVQKINEFTNSGTKMDEPSKRTLVYELRERLGNLDVENYKK